jgi:hypothetical protein
MNGTTLRRVDVLHHCDRTNGLPLVLTAYH